MRISDWSSDVCSSDLQLEQFPQPPRDLGIFGGILRRAVERNLGEADLRFAGPAHFLERDADMVEVEFRELVEPVLMLPRIECETHHQRIVIRREDRKSTRLNSSH